MISTISKTIVKKKRETVTDDQCLWQHRIAIEGLRASFKSNLKISQNCYAGIQISVTLVVTLLCRTSSPLP
jgi:hypothetical protein